MDSIYNLSLGQAFYLIIILTAFTFFLIQGIRVFLIKFQKGPNRNTTKDTQKENILNRAKYPSKDVFRHRGSFLMVGFIFSLAFVVLAFNLTQSDRTFLTENGPAFIEDEIEIRRTPHEEIKKQEEYQASEEIEPEEFTEEIQEEPELIKEHIRADEVIIDTFQTITGQDLELPTLPEPPEEEEEDLPLIRAEQMPRFPGCEDLEGSKAEKEKCAEKKLLEFIYSKIKYPSLARQNNIEGTVVVSFIVRKNGMVEFGTVLRDIGGGCGAEVQRIIGLMNDPSLRWTPGHQQGRPVSVKFTLPVKFVIDP